jgi:restriction system protein
MSDTPVVWGIHMGRQVGTRPVEGNYVAIDAHKLGDLRELPKDRETIKALVAKRMPDAKQGAIPVYAGISLRFAHEMKAGDLVVYPSKIDRMVNIGRFTGEAEYVPDDADGYPNRRKVQWLGQFPRSDFSQEALYEIGSFITVFLVQQNRREFLAKIGMAPAIIPTEVEDVAVDDDTAALAASQQAEETTTDFVLRRITSDLSGYEFEEFVAHLLECMGYTARVTPRSGDGGVDIIAHKDALGFEPPIIKVQCKRIAAVTGEPDVNQLLGTLGEGEYGLFVSVSSFSRSAVLLGRNRSKLRLIDGEQLVELIFDHYDRLAPRYRSIIPLKQIYVPDLPLG